MPGAGLRELPSRGLVSTLACGKDQPHSVTASAPCSIRQDSHVPPSPRSRNCAMWRASRGSTLTSWLPATPMTSMPASDSLLTPFSSALYASKKSSSRSTTSPASSTAFTPWSRAAVTVRRQASAGPSSRACNSGGSRDGVRPRCMSPTARIFTSCCSSVAVRHSPNADGFPRQPPTLANAASRIHRPECGSARADNRQGRGVAFTAGIRVSSSLTGRLIPPEPPDPSPRTVTTVLARRSPSRAQGCFSRCRTSTLTAVPGWPRGRQRPLATSLPRAPAPADRAAPAAPR